MSGFEVTTVCYLLASKMQIAKAQSSVADSLQRERDRLINKTNIICACSEMLFNKDVHN